MGLHHPFFLGDFLEVSDISRQTPTLSVVRYDEPRPQCVTQGLYRQIHSLVACIGTPIEVVEDFVSRY